MWASFGLLFLVAACEDAPKLRPGEHLGQFVSQAGFTVTPIKARLAEVKKLSKRESSDCWEAYHDPTTLYVCFHHFKSTMKAVEAGAAVNKRKWPQGRFWVTTVRGRTLVFVDARLHDRPVAQKLSSVFATYETP